MIAGNNQPALAVFKSWSAVPENLRTRSQWKKRQRQVRKGEKPTALLEWCEFVTCESERIDTDGSVTTWKRQVPMKRQVALFAEEQTTAYKPRLRTSATVVFRHRFIENASKDKYLWWCGQPLGPAEEPGWRTCGGRLQDWHLKKHLKGDERYGVRGDVWTNFGAIDHDLHDGEPDIFLEQFRVLLGQFQGKDGWHYQVAERDAGGVHFYQTFRSPVMVAVYREKLRKQLQELDLRHPKLAARSRAAGMKTLGELEIFPDPEKGIRLPLCAGRTMLLDRPLGLVFNKRSQRRVQDVVGYVAWLLKADKTYMPAEDVFEYVKQRLKAKQPLLEPKEGITPPPKKGDSKRPRPAGKAGSLGKMRGRYDKVLVDFWTGKNNPPDTLNDGIRLLALVLPFFGKTEAEAVALIEDYIDALPDWTFSDRLSTGDRAEVSRVVKNTVRQAYHGNGGQPDPATSTAKLLATAQAWKRKGFDPTDKATWNTPAPNRTISLAPDFTWTPQELQWLAQMQPILHTDLGTAANAVRHVLRLVKGHQGETGVPFVKQILESYGIRCGHHGKVNAFLKLLCRWDWLYIKVPENWHKRQADGKQRRGRARTYGVGKEMQHKFRPVAGGGAKALPVLHNPHTQTEPIYYVPSLLSESACIRPDESPFPLSSHQPLKPNLYITSHHPPLHYVGVCSRPMMSLITKRTGR